MGFTRTLTITGTDIVKLLQALSAPQPVRCIDDTIPHTAALAGTTYNADTGELELRLVCHEWPADIRDTPIRLTYARRYGPADDHNAWSAPIPLGTAE